MRRALYRGYAATRTRELLRRLAEIEKTQWLSRDAIEALQAARLRAMLVRAAREVPYYRDLFGQTGFDPGAIRSSADLRALPILEKETISQAFDRLRAASTATPASRATTIRSTGGSTGRPVRFLVDREEMAARSAHIYRNLRWLGWDLGDRAAYVWGSDIDAKDHAGWRGALRDSVAGVPDFARPARIGHSLSSADSRALV